MARLPGGDATHRRGKETRLRKPRKVRETAEKIKAN
ncbi:hypothetical protein TGP89_243220, partial [Toxoplasma gondii p89]